MNKEEKKVNQTIEKYLVTEMEIVSGEEYIENMDKNRTKTDGFFKRTVKSISEKMNSLFIDE